MARRRLNDMYIKLTRVNNYYHLFYGIRNTDIEMKNFMHATEHADELKYFNTLLEYKTFELDKEYEFVQLADLINPTKSYIYIEYFENLQDLIILPEKFTSKVYSLLFCNAVINEFTVLNIPMQMLNEDNKFHKLTIVDDIYNTFRLCKINDSFYELNTFLKKYMPYIICVTKDNNYYVANMFEKSIKTNIPLHKLTFIKVHRLYSNIEELLSSQTTLLSMYTTYKNITENLNRCLNESDKMYNLLNEIKEIL